MILWSSYFPNDLAKSSVVAYGNLTVGLIILSRHSGLNNLMVALKYCDMLYCGVVC